MSRFDTSILPADFQARILTAPEGSAERVVQAMAHLADHVGVREVGTNSGPWVARFLKSVGLGPGYPWCAAALDWACDVAGVWSGDSGAVATWVAKARKAGRLRRVPKRGYACWRLNPDGRTGHIGVVLNVRSNGLVESAEGNTSPGVRGSQRDGDGLYRRQRDLSFWHGYIDLERLP